MTKEATVRDLLTRSLPDAVRERLAVDSTALITAGLAARSGVNVVEPIGGPASFYTNWDAPSNFNNQPFRYMWNCVITNTLIRGLDSRGYRVGNGKYAIRIDRLLTGSQAGWLGEQSV